MAKKRKPRASSVDTSPADASSVQPSSVDGRPVAPASVDSSPPSSGLERRADDFDDLIVDDAGYSEEAERNNVSRCAKLRRAGVDADRCALLGIDLAVGPRAPAHACPVQIHVTARGVKHAVWVSQIAVSMLVAGLSAEALEHAAEFLRDVREV